MKKLKIFVCCHKPYSGYRDDVYTPIHVGRAISACKEEMGDMIGDDTGDNISEKNAAYSEATGIYWIWKNVHDCEYVGLHHYRRFFADRFTNENIDSYFADGTDVLLCRPYFCSRTYRFYYTLMTMSCEDLLILKAVIAGTCPEYLLSFEEAMNDYTCIPYNMVICRKTLYDDYAKWMFSVLFNAEKFVKESPYPNSKRLIGYFAEILTPLYFIHNGKRIKYQLFDNDGVLVPWSLKARVANFVFHRCVYPFIKHKKQWVDPSIIRGLLQTGINLEEIRQGKI